MTADNLTPNIPIFVSAEGPDGNYGSYISIGGENVRRVQIISKETVRASNSTDVFKINLTIDPKIIYNYAGTALVEDTDDIQHSSSQGTTLNVCFRELDYCDAAGNEQRIIVLASQPYNKP